MNKDNLERWSRLYTLAMLNEAQIKANPLPHLHKMSDQVCAMREAIEQALIIMSGVDQMDIAHDLCPGLEPSMVETSLERQRRASEVLRKAIHD